MQNIALLLSCLAIGAALRRYSSIPDNAHTALNAFIINVAFPALALLQVHNLHLKPGLAYSVLMPWLLFIVGAGAFWLLGRLFNLRREAIGALMLTGGLGNTSFIGLPMIDAFYGRDDLATGILIDTLGTYLVLSTLGVTIACVYSRRSSGTAAIVRRVLTFPPLIAVVVAIPLMNVQYPTLLADVLSRLGATLAPLALVSVGLQLRFDAWRGNGQTLAAGLGYKLFAAPALIGLLYLGLFRLNGDNVRVTLFEAAMAPQIGGSIVASQYGLAPELVTLMVGVGTLLSFVTLPCWWRVLSLV